jgi:hypothetical protein
MYCFMLMHSRKSHRALVEEHVRMRVAHVRCFDCCDTAVIAAPPAASAVDVRGVVPALPASARLDARAPP